MWWSINCHSDTTYYLELQSICKVLAYWIKYLLQWEMINVWTEDVITSSCGKVHASPSTSIPSVARKRRSGALDRITKDSGVSWFLISSAINFTIRWFILHIFWPRSSSLAIHGCNSLSAWQANEARKVTKNIWWKRYKMIKDASQKLHKAEKYPIPKNI